MSPEEFYENYWLAADASDQLVESRKQMLVKTLKDVPKGSRVLDAGCGQGVFTAFFSSMGFEAVGVDLSSTGLDTARALHPGLSFKPGQLDETIPFDDSEFDAVWCSEVLEHLFDVRRALWELNRVLRREGKLVITVPYHGLFKNLLVGTLFFDRHFDPCGPHIRFFSRRGLNACLQATGFAVDEWCGVGRYWPVWMSHFVVARKVKDLVAR